MFGKQKTKPSIDQEQLALIKTAEKRIKQKKRLYIHFVVFLIGAVFLILANTVLGIGKDFKIAGLEWFVIAIGIWLFLLVYHFISVFITHNFMGKAWEDRQREVLVSKQQERIEQLKLEYLKEEKEIAKSQAYNEALEVNP
ncbi:2TM domain-containing protein, partial [Psychroserpens sp.]|uniref:2TM domain-containing protein n=1 Tax=Psychroserpens sp. TaxID=2020870 RepID=UPI00385B2A95